MTRRKPRKTRHPAALGGILYLIHSGLIESASSNTSANYYFLTTFHGTDLMYFAAFCPDLAMMKMSCGHYEQNSECRSVLITRQIAAKGGIL